MNAVEIHLIFLYLLFLLLFPYFLATFQCRHFSVFRSLPEKKKEGDLLCSNVDLGSSKWLIVSFFFCFWKYTFVCVCVYFLRRKQLVFNDTTRDVYCQIQQRRKSSVFKTRNKHASFSFCFLQHQSDVVK